MRGSATNRITVVDGLAQMRISAQLHDSMNKNPSTGGPAAIGINLNATTGSPTFVAQTATTTAGNYDAVLNRLPVKGLWFVQAMENAPNGATATFGGSGFQELSVQVED